MQGLHKGEIRLDSNKWQIVGESENFVLVQPASMWTNPKHNDLVRLMEQMREWNYVFRGTRPPNEMARPTFIFELGDI